MLPEYVFAYGASSVRRMKASILLAAFLFVASLAAEKENQHRTADWIEQEIKKSAKKLLHIRGAVNPAHISCST